MRSILLRRHSRWASAAFGTKEELLAQHSSGESWLRGLDLNQRPSGYEPDELPGCSTPRDENTWAVNSLQIEKSVPRARNAFVFRRIATSLNGERENSCWHRELVGPGFCGALVSEKTGGGRPITL